MKIPTPPPPTREIESAEMMRCFLDLELAEFIRKANEEYYPWHSFRYKDIPSDLPPETVWQAAKIARGLHQVHFKIGSYHYRVPFTFTLSDKIHQQLHIFDMNLGGNLSGKTLIPERDKDRYLINSIMEEAIASSQLEGAVTTRKVAKDMLLKERKPTNKSEQMILNNYQTIQQIVAWQEKDITIEALLELQKLVTKETLDNPEYAGKFRDNDEVKVWEPMSGRILHSPPPCEYLEDLMVSFCDFAKNDPHGKFIHPIVKASILHFLIGYIHPFEDGNGRTARAIFYWYLVKQGYWLLEYMSISQMIKEAPIQYAKAYLYTEQDENDVTYFIKYKLRTVDKAFKSLKKYIQQQVKERKQLFELSTVDGLNERQASIIREFIVEPTKLMTIKEVENTFGVVYQTARTDLLGLKELGLLQMKTEGKKKMVFFRGEGLARY